MKIPIKSLFSLSGLMKGTPVPREYWRQGIDVLQRANPEFPQADRDLLVRAIDAAFHGDVFGDEFAYLMNVSKGLNRKAMLNNWLFEHEICNSPSSSNIYFSPSYYVRKGFITAADVDKLKAGAKLLSVGSGPAFLERFLVAEGVPAKNIFLSDLKLDYLPKDTSFEKRQFDMWGIWYRLSRKFDYIIFPESIFPKISTNDEIIAEYLQKQGDPRQILDARDEARIINGYYYSQLLKQALTYLKKDGVLRARHFNPGLESNVLEELALQDGHKISATLHDNDGSELRIKKIS